MKHLLIAASLPLALAACTTPGPGGDQPRVKTNFQYSNAGGLGTQNAGFLQPGTFYVWNTETGDLIKIGNLDLTPVSTNGTAIPGKQESSSVAGFRIEGIPASLQGQESAIKASIGAQARFFADGVVREDYRDVKTKLTEYVTSEVANGRNPDLTLRPRDPNYRVVVINSALRSTNSSLSIGGTDASDPNKVADVSIGTGSTTLGSIKVQAGTSTKCGSATGGTGAPICFFNTAVYDPEYVAGLPTLQWIEAKGGSALSQAFRQNL